MARKWEYRVTIPMLPMDATSPVMDCRQMERWLNEDMDAHGWEFVGHGATHWRGNDPFVQDWWVFRRPFPGPL